MADVNSCIVSVKNSMHSVDVCINSALAKSPEENGHNLL